MSHRENIVEPHVKYIVLGGGGHAEMIIETLYSNGISESIGILDTNPHLWNTFIKSTPILGGDDLLSNLIEKGAIYFIVGLGSTYNNEPRQRLFELGLANGLTPLTLIHPSATVSTSSKINTGSVVMPGAIINSGCTIGSNVIINTGAILEHGCQIGNHVHVASGSTICGSVIISDYAHIGAGSTIIQNVSIGEQSVVGAGAVVIKDVNASTIVAGVPSKIIRVINRTTK